MTITAPAVGVRTGNRAKSSARRREKAKTQPAPPEPLSPGARLAITVLLLLTGLACWLIAFVFLLSGLQEHHSQSVLYSRFRQQLAEGTAPPFGYATTLKPGEPVALITAPSVGLHHTVVVEGTSSDNLQAGPGHLPGTVLPGEVGVSTVLGRASAYGAPFRHLTSLRPGSRLTVTTGQGIFRYSVVDVRGPGAAVPASLRAVSSRLTLVTAATAGWRDLWAPTHAVFVDAALVGKAVPVASGPPAAAADQIMSGDSGALVPLVLWLEGLLVGGLALVWSRSRLARPQVWLIGVPVIAALLWGASASFVQLLPNLL